MGMGERVLVKEDWVFIKVCLNPNSHNLRRATYLPPHQNEKLIIQGALRLLFIWCGVPLRGTS